MQARSKEIGAALRCFGLELPALSATNVHSKVYCQFNGGGLVDPVGVGWVKKTSRLQSDRFDEALHENGIVRRSL